MARRGKVTAKEVFVWMLSLSIFLVGIFGYYLASTLGGERIYIPSWTARLAYGGSDFAYATQYDLIVCQFNSTTSTKIHIDIYSTSDYFNLTQDLVYNVKAVEIILISVSPNSSVFARLYRRVTATLGYGDWISLLSNRTVRLNIFDSDILSWKLNGATSWGVKIKVVPSIANTIYTVKLRVKLVLRENATVLEVGKGFYVAMSFIAGIAAVTGERFMKTTRQRRRRKSRKRRSRTKS